MQTDWYTIANSVKILQIHIVKLVNMHINNGHTLKKVLRWLFSRTQWITVNPEPISCIVTRLGSFIIMAFTTSKWPFSIANMNGFMSQLSEALVSAPLQMYESKCRTSTPCKWLFSGLLSEFQHGYRTGEDFLILILLLWTSNTWDQAWSPCHLVNVFWAPADLQVSTTFRTLTTTIV